jgi:hypothetical protein
MVKLTEECPALGVYGAVQPACAAKVDAPDAEDGNALKIAVNGLVPVK